MRAGFVRRPLLEALKLAEARKQVAIANRIKKALEALKDLQIPG
jgi:hypothetical protein